MPLEALNALLRPAEVLPQGVAHALGVVMLDHRLEFGVRGRSGARTFAFTAVGFTRDGNSAAVPKGVRGAGAAQAQPPKEGGVRAIRLRERLVPQRPSLLEIKPPPGLNLSVPLLCKPQPRPVRSRAVAVR